MANLILWKNPANPRQKRVYINGVAGVPVGASGYIRPNGFGSELVVKDNRTLNAYRAAVTLIGVMGRGGAIRDTPFVVFEMAAKPVSNRHL